MTETKPTYNATAELDAARQRQLQYEALDCAGQAERDLLALIARVSACRWTLTGNADDSAKQAARRELRVLKLAAAAARAALVVLVVAFLFTAVTPAAAESEPELPALLFVVTGQSNAGPKGIGGEPVPGAWLYAPRDVGDFWSPMAGIGRYQRYGVGLPFARAVTEATGRTVLIVNVYSGGTSIIAWQPDAPNPDWQRAMRSVGNGRKRPMYAQVRAAVADASAAWGGPVDVAGVLYVQVERDSRQKQPTYYEGALRRLIAAWRADYGDGLPVMFIDAHTHMSSGGPMVAAAVRAVAADTPRTALILLDGVEKNPSEPAHFSSAGLDELGARFAAAWLALEANQ